MPAAQFCCIAVAEVGSEAGQAATGEASPDSCEKAALNVTTPSKAFGVLSVASERGSRLFWGKQQHTDLPASTVTLSLVEQALLAVTTAT